MADPERQQFEESYKGYRDWRTSALRSNWDELHKELGLKQYLFSEGNAPLYRDVAEPFDFTPTTIERVTGAPFVKRFDPEYSKKQADIQTEALARRLLAQKKAPQNEQYIEDTKELKRNLSNTSANRRKIELAQERQVQIEALRKAHPDLDKLASEIESEAFKEFSLARESDNIINGASLQNRELTPIESERINQIKSQEASIVRKQAKIVKLLSRWDTEMKSLGLDPAKFGGKKMGHLLSAPGIAADVSQIAAIAGVGPMKNYDNTGATYTNDEVVEVGGVTRVRSEVEELSAYHPDNAKNHPEISDLDRIDYFRRRGASKEVMSGLPGYEKWKSEQDSKNKIIINPSSVMFKPFFQ